jgi:hypothetical protein
MKILENNQVSLMSTNAASHSSISTINIKNKILNRMYNGLFNSVHGNVLKGTRTILLNNINLHNYKFKNASNFKVHPKIRFRIVHMLDQLKAEQVMAKKNLNLINAKLRKQLRAENLNHRLKDLEIEKKFKEFKILTQNKTLSRVVRELDVQDEFNANMIKSNSILIKDRLIDIFSDVLKKLRDSHEKRVELVRGQHQIEMLHIRNLNTVQMKKLDDLIVCIDYEAECELTKSNLKLKCSKDDLVSMHSKRMLALKLEYEKKTSMLNAKFDDLRSDEKLYKHYLNSYLHLIRTNGENDKRFLTNQMLIRDYESRIRCIQEAYDRPSDSSVNMDELESLRSTYHKLSRDFKSLRKENNSRLRRLCVISSSCVDQLELKLKKAVNILKLFELCQKYECKHSTYNHDTYKVYEPLAWVDYASADINIYHECMTKFHKKFNLVSLQVRILQKGNADLIEQIKNLKLQLKDYLIKWNVNEINFTSNTFE